MSKPYYCANCGAKEVPTNPDHDYHFCSDCGGILDPIHTCMVCGITLSTDSAVCASTVCLDTLWNNSEPADISKIAAMEAEYEYWQSDAGVVENYFDRYFNEGFPRNPFSCVRSHSNRIHRVYWKKLYNPDSADWWGFDMLAKAALLEKQLYVPIIRCEEPCPF